jgi:two-component system KDP operon response regulator KdpE
MAIILIVDDDADARWVLGHLIGRDRHRVLEARDGREAVELFRSRRPDLVLLDLYMPEQDGFETLRVLRGEFPGSRIIVVSAGWNVGGVDGLRKARELGADATIRKPIDIDAVRRAVAELLEAA